MQRPKQTADEAERNPSSAAFFDQKYRDGKDPWDFATSGYEQTRYDAVLRALADRRYANGFEPGCSIGELSKRLITVCDRLEAIDFSAAAIETARANNAQSGIDYRVMGLPERLPLIGFDLIVLSEIGYYFPLAQWTAMVQSMVDTAAPGATFLAAHWLGHSDDHQTHADQVHAVLRSEPRLHLLHEERHPGFRIDRLERRE